MTLTTTVPVWHRVSVDDTGNGYRSLTRTLLRLSHGQGRRSSGCEPPPGDQSTNYSGKVRYTFRWALQSRTLCVAGDQHSSTYLREVDTNWGEYYLAMNGAVIEEEKAGAGEWEGSGGVSGDALDVGDEIVDSEVAATGLCSVCVKWT